MGWDRVGWRKTMQPLNIRRFNNESVSLSFMLVGIKATRRSLHYILEI